MKENKDEKEGQVGGSAGGSESEGLTAGSLGGRERATLRELKTLAT